MNLHQVSPEEWADWFLNPTTRAFTEVVRRRVQGLKDNWASGYFTRESESGTVALNASAIGACKALQEILELSCEQVNEELSDEE